jgi:glycosyltransferase involved in cell wall biosynthesis
MVVSAALEYRMKVSIIIPCRNAATTLATQLEALARQSWPPPWEVIVVDNGSSDGSLGVVAAFRGRLPALRVCAAHDRLGASYARNVGARVAAAGAFAFCDADDEVGDGWLAAIGEALRDHDVVASRFDTEKLNPPWLVRSRRNKQRDGLPTLAQAPYFKYCGTCGLGVSRALHEAVGGFDESLTAAEDADYCYRLQLAGGKLHFVSDAVVHIRYRQPLPAQFRQAAAWASASVRLHARYRPRQVAPLPWPAAIGEWRRLAQRIVKRGLGVRDRATMAAWVWELGWTLGRLRGCVRHGIRWPV